jgi:hypothetical protein
MLLRSATALVGYRFRDYVTPVKFELPADTPEILKGEEGVKEIKEKARASSATAGVFLAFDAGILAALISIEGLNSVLDPLRSPDRTLTLAVFGVVFPYLMLREQRRISAARAEEKLGRGSVKQLRCKHYWHLALWSVGLIGTFLPLFLNPSARLGPALSLSGFFLILLSLLLLVLSVEFYDTAGSWQAGDDEVYHFHMASIASHCYLVGLSLGFVGISLLLCRAYPRTGCVIATGVIIALMTMSEIERELYGLHAARKPKGTDPVLASQSRCDTTSR